MRTLAALSALVLATPAYAASGPFFSLGNTDFVVTLGFIGFILVLVYFKVPSMLGKMLDQRADGIKNELDEARSLRDEAQSILASYERKQKEVQEQAARIVEGAKAEAEAAAEQAKEDLANSVARRMAAAEDQIASAQAAAEKDVRDAAVNVAIGAAREVIAAQLTAAAANKLIDAAISDVEDKLH
jgi:F-type H+-transporting ATPase subunit b